MTETCREHGYAPTDSPGSDSALLCCVILQVSHCPAKSGVIRVDNYWCRSAFLSCAPRSSVDAPGTHFITVFCDDQKVANDLAHQPIALPRSNNMYSCVSIALCVLCVWGVQVPLPPMVVDVLSAQGEKVVPDSLARLHAVARNIEHLRRSARASAHLQDPAGASSRSVVQ